jgi:hypothetical protein
LPPAALLAGRVHGPSNTMKFRGAACGAHPRALRFHVPCLSCGLGNTPATLWAASTGEAMGMELQGGGGGGGAPASP